MGGTHGGAPGGRGAPAGDGLLAPAARPPHVAYALKGLTRTPRIKKKASLSAAHRLAKCRMQECG